MGVLKRFFIILLLMVMSAVLAAGSCVFYAVKIEPYRLQVNVYGLNQKSENSMEVKIVQFSDLHIKEDFTCENLEKIVRRINEQKPDIVVFTGDLYDNYAIYHDDKEIIKQLSAIHAAYGKIAVWGNRDYGGGAARQYASIMEQAGFRLLKNETECITAEKQKKILFTGLDDSMLGNPYMPDFEKMNDYDYAILLSHEPDIVENYADYAYNMVLSGHSHGGQVNIPFLPQINRAALSATNLAADYSRGMYDLRADGSSKLYVNTGIGTTHISARFGVIPEITIFYLYL